MKVQSRTTFLCLLIVFVPLIFLIDDAGAGDNLKFPLRAKYSQLSFIDSEELASVYDRAIIIDSRDRTQYIVIHMEGAKNIMIRAMHKEDLVAVRPEYDDRPIVFYSNDPNSSKSYQDGAKAVKWGFKNVRVYDAGIFHWAKMHPQRTMFFGEKLTSETARNIKISEEKFNSVLLAPRDFIARSKSRQYTIIDGRQVERIRQRPIKMPNIKLMSIELMANLLKRKIWTLPSTDLLVIDNTGEQVRWLQYYFEREGINNYYFLKGGARQWFADGYDSRGRKR